MGDDKAERELSPEAEAAANERPAVPLHDPFNRFDFEPTDGGDF